MKISVLITCYNRKPITIACLEALFRNVLPKGCTLKVFLVDDGSTDGTASAVQAAFPRVELLSGDGDLYWCRGMYKAFETALSYQFDYYLWLNDDTMLEPDALLRLIECEAAVRGEKASIIVGSTVDAKTRKLSYGGLIRRSRFKPTTFERLAPSSLPLPCDSMSGNIVLIPTEVATAVGNLDPVFEHAMGDIDYALRARQTGFGVWLAPGIYGTCSNNFETGTFLDASQPFVLRWKQIMGRKGLPCQSWMALTRRHGGPLWFLYFCWPYIKLLMGGYRSR